MAIGDAGYDMVAHGTGEAQTRRFTGAGWHHRAVEGGGYEGSAHREPAAGGASDNGENGILGAV
ncbi:hypothetical protein ACNJD8_22735, partial [Mycobacterium tuberculosis]|uniref:hypothetical protein n=1 Tax=Bacteria TaxID=2 RepID=UPI001A9C642D|nr:MULTISPECIES: hypothetical protein [Bacteria]